MDTIVKARKQLWLVVLLALATVHCAQSIFFDNYSYINLQKYADGQERMPYQGRIALIPLMRSVHSMPRLQQYAHSLQHDDGNTHLVIEKYTAEKLASFVLGTLSLFVIVAACGWYGWRSARQFWWLCPVIGLVIFYTSYAARAVDNNLWYPYDLPHAALFTLGLLFTLNGRWYLAAAVFLLDTPIRETSIFLLPCLLSVGYVRRQLKRVLIVVALLGTSWLALRLYVNRLFAHNPTELNLRYHTNLHALLHLQYWPQLASIMGFLILPVVLFRQYLTQEQKALMVGAIPGVLISALLGVWYETRVWAEWNGIVACLAFVIFTRYLQTRELAAYREGSQAARQPGWQTKAFSQLL